MSNVSPPAPPSGVETTTESVTRTVVVPLETSERKNQVVKAALGPVQRVMARTADTLPSFPERTWGGRSTQLYRQQVKDRPDSEREITLPSGETKKLKAQVPQAAFQTVSSNFKTWRTNGKRGDPPSRDQYLSASYLPLNGDTIDIVANDRGYGLEADFISYGDSVWWHAATSQYHRRYFERVVDGEAEAGYTELHLDDDGGLTAHISVSWDVKVIDAEDIDRYLGVYISPSVLYSGAVVDLDPTRNVEQVLPFAAGSTDADAGSGGERPDRGGTDGRPTPEERFTGAPIDDVRGVAVEKADEYRHHRAVIRNQRERRSENGDLRGVKQARSEFRRYTDHICHVASRDIVNLAREHQPCAIRLTDLDNIREELDVEEVHRWPYRLIQENIIYKATAAGIPVETVPTPYIRRTCRRCGTAVQQVGSTFNCHTCGYDVDAAVNAACIVAAGGVQDEVVDGADG